MGFKNKVFLNPIFMCNYALGARHGAMAPQL